MDEDKYHRVMYDLYNSTLDKQLFISLIKLISDITGDDHTRLCRKFEIKDSQIGSLSLIDGSNIYNILIVNVDQQYRHNLDEIRNSLSSEAAKFEFTKMIMLCMDKMNLYYKSLQYFNSGYFERVDKMSTDKNVRSIRRDKYDNFFIEENGSRMGLLAVKAKNSEAMNNALPVKQILDEFTPKE